MSNNSVVKHRLQVNPIEAPIVIKIFNLYSEGYGIKSIAMKLNELGYRTRTGKEWHKNAVIGILQNEAYLGWSIFNKQNKRKTAKRLNPESEWVIVKGSHPAIISEEVFMAVKAKLKANSEHTNNNTRSQYSLSGLIKCGTCGAPYGVSGYGKKKDGNFTYAYATCSNQTKGRGCTNVHVRMDEIETEVIRLLKEKILNPESVDAVLKELNRFAEEYSDRDRLSTLKQQVEEINVKIAKYFEMIEQNTLSMDNVNARLSELNGQKSVLMDEIMNIENNTPKIYTREDCIRIQKDTLKILDDPNPQRRKEAYRKVIQSIIVNSSGTFELRWRY